MKAKKGLILCTAGLCFLVMFSGACSWLVNQFGLQGFDTAVWTDWGNGDTNLRYRMLDDLEGRKLSAGMGLDAALTLLGSPDDRSDADGLVRLYYQCGMPESSLTLIDPIVLYLEFSQGVLVRYWHYES